VHSEDSGARIYLEVIKPDQVDFIYEIRMLEQALPDYAYPGMTRVDAEVDKYYRAEVFLRRGGQSYNIYGFDQQDIITDILDQFEKHLHFLHISPGNLPWKMAEHDEMLHLMAEAPDPDTR
jgi:choline/glycine/proline betaine transport protein